MGTQEADNSVRLSDTKKPYCHKHEIGVDDERWQAAFQELINGEEEHIEPFQGQVCPMCFLGLRERNRKNRRQLRVESSKAVRLQSEVAHLRRVVEAVASVVKNETGKDPFALVGKVFPRPCYHQGVPGSAAIDREEVGKLERILPNLVIEAIRSGKKLQPPQEKVQNPTPPVQ